MPRPGGRGTGASGVDRRRWRWAGAAGGGAASLSAVLDALTVLLAQSDPANPLGEGRLDNTIVDPEVHLVWGMVVLATMVLAAVWLVVLAVTGRSVTRGPRLALVAAQVALMGQALLGIKLLDQGMGVVQLYIHYVGGLLPLGLFLAAGWVDWRSDRTRTRALAVLTSAGLLSATMAFTIGRAYVNG